MIRLDDEGRDTEILINRISEALYVHSKMVAAEEGAADHGFSIIAVAQDEEEGWLDVAMNELDDDGSFGETRVLRIEVKITDDYKPRTKKGD